MATVRAYVALGSNLGDPRATLTAATHALDALPRVGVRDVSRLYATKPVGVTDQPGFLNAAVALNVPAGPTPETGAVALLLTLKELERAFGRKERTRWGPRELDLDLLVFGRHRMRVERPEGATTSNPRRGDAAAWLEVPHPSARERLFVLAPLADVAPGLVPPGWAETVETARRRREIVEGRWAVRPIASWDARRREWSDDA